MSYIKKYSVYSILFILFFCFSCGYKENNLNSGVFLVREDIINKGMLYDSSLDSDFVEYVYDEYDIDILNDVISYSEERGYSKSICHEVTDLSINVLYDYYNNEFESIDNVMIIETQGDITLSFVGDISLADDGNISYEFIPCFQNDFKTIMLYGNDKNRVINDMRNHSINTIFDDSGYFYRAS